MSSKQTMSNEGPNDPVPVSSSSSLDTFLLGLPASSDTAGIAASLPEFQFRTSPELGSNTPLILPGSMAGNSVPEFLYQLTKMLTDDNGDVIEWSKGVIEVHNPRRLETEILQRYFRHSKFASFQRQLNYFGFRKLAGKGKMAPCSYVNQSVSEDLSSLLKIKRKTHATPREKGTTSKGTKRRSNSGEENAEKPSTSPSRTKSAPSNTSRPPEKVEPRRRKPPTTQIEIARSAVGRGIRYSSVARERALAMSSQKAKAVQLAASEVPVSAAASADTKSNLTELEMNYQNTLSDLKEGAETDAITDFDPTPLSQMRSSSSPFGSGAFSGFLSRSSSLVDLAMIPNETAKDAEESTGDEKGLSFVDFPHPEVHPSTVQAKNVASKTHLP